MKPIFRNLMYLLVSSGLLSPARSEAWPQSGLPVIAGPLRVYPGNPRYFTNDTGRAVYLTGSHTWSNFQDEGGGPPAPGARFDFDGFLDFLETNHHNFLRLWVWESTCGSAWHKGEMHVSPMVYRRTGPGTALDGRPKFDVTQFDPAYFARLKARVKAAQDRGLYVGVMLFQGFSVAKKSSRAHGNPWPGHPFHRANNINGIDGDTDQDGNGYEAHTLGIPRITQLQETYVRKVIDTVGDFDNVIFEISNESHGESTAWQYHMIDLIRDYERQRSKRHPVWMSFQFDETLGAGNNMTLFRSKADAVSPRQEAGPREDYKADPPLADGSKVILLDTDHLWGIGGDAAWVWKVFTRGMHPLFMDPYRDAPRRPWSRPDPRWDAVRKAMGLTRRVAQSIDLAAMLPSDDSAQCSTRYCLRDPGKAYLVYLPGGNSLFLRLEAGTYRAEWFDPVTGKIKLTESIETPSSVIRKLTSPRAGAWVLFVRALSTEPLRSDAPAGIPVEP